MNSTNDLVTIVTFSDSIEASIAEEALKSKGIQCVLVGKHAAEVTGYLGIAEGIRLQVKNSDRLEAEKIVNSFNIRKTTPSKKENNFNLIVLISVAVIVISLVLFLSS